MAALGFTPASEQDIFSIEAEQSRCKTTSVISGEEAMQFYENVFKDDKKQFVSTSVSSKKDNGREQHCRRKSRESNRRARRRVRAEIQQVQNDSVVQSRINGESEGNQRRETNNAERSMELQGLRLLRCAHEGNISGLKDLLSKGVDINFQVQYLLPS